MGDIFEPRPGVVEDRRKEEKCCKCHSRLSFPCIVFTNKFMIKCVFCGHAFEAKRDGDRAAFHKIASSYNGE